MEKVLIVGGSGLLGANWAAQIRTKFETHVCLNNVDTNLDHVFKHRIPWSKLVDAIELVRAIGPNIIVNAAGLTNVSECEKYPERSFQANVELAINVAKISSSCGAKLVHISTDHIFDGSSKYKKENELTRPLNRYAQDKLAAEKLVLQENSSALVCRTNFFGWGPVYRQSFSDLLLENLKKDQVIPMFDDVFFTPLTTSQLIDLSHSLVLENKAGLINVCGNERVSKYDFAKRLATAFGLDPNLIQPVQASRIKTGVKRPLDLSLSDQKIRAELDIQGITVEESINRLKSDKSACEEVRRLGRLIPYGKHFIDSDDVEVVSKTLRSGTLTQGPNVSLFEESIAKYTGAKHAVAVSSATAGLHLAYLAAGLVPKKFILTSPITFVSTANASLFCGGSVEFADIDRDTINIGHESVKKALESNPDIQIVVPVLFGGSADGVPEICQLAKSYGKFVVEDAAHGLGGSYQCGAKIGSCRYSDATVFSLHPVKSIAAGEGGVVTTNDSELYEKLISLRSHGITREVAKFKQTDLAKTDQKINLWYYEMQRLGYHYRLTDIQASLANSQLQKLDKFIAKRREIAAKYIRFLENFQFIKPAQSIDINLSANHLFIAEFDLTSLNIRRNDIMEQLRLNNIITQVHYIPVPIQSYYQKIGMRGDNLPNSMAYYERCLSLPVYYDLTDDDLTLVFENLRNIETKKNKR